ncbi:MAG: hypothetical protein QXN68_04395, partial [Thermoplasmata archaeon]
MRPSLSGELYIFGSDNKLYRFVLYGSIINDKKSISILMQIIKASLGIEIVDYCIIKYNPADR